MTLRVGFRGVLLYAAALLPVGLSVAAHAVGAAAQPVAAGDERPALAFEQYMVNLGPVPPTPFISGRFTFRNAGNVPLHITDLEPSCGCLSPRMAKRDYLPGEKGEFLVGVETPGEAAGPKEYTIKVRYKDPRPRVETVKFRVTLPEPQVVVDPRALMIYQFTQEATEEDLVVTDNLAEPLEITSIACDSDLVTARLIGWVDGDSKSRRQLVKVRVAGVVPPGRTRALVTIHTSNSAYRELHVPLILQGRTEGPGAGASPVTVSPERLWFDRNGPQSMTQRVTVTDRRAEPLRPTAVSTSSEFVTATIGASGLNDAGHSRFEVEVTVSDELPAGRFRDTLTVVTDDAAHRKIEVPLVIESSGADPGPATAVNEE